MSNTRNKILKRFVLALLLSIPCILFLSYHVYLQALRSMTDQFHTQQLLIAKQTARGFEKDIKRLVREVELLSQEPFIIDLDTEEAIGALANTLKYLKQFNIADIAILNSAGIVEIPLISKELTGVDFSFRKYFIQAKKQNKRIPTFQFITFKGVEKGKKGIVIAMPIMHPRKGFNGVVVLILKAEAFIDGSLPTEKAGHTIWVYEDGGNIVYFPSHKFGASMGALSNTNAAFLDFFERSNSTKEIYSEYISNSGQKMLVTSYTTNIAEQKWVVGVTAPMQKVEESIARFNTKYIMATSFIILLIITGAGFVVYAVSRLNILLQGAMAEREMAKEQREQLVSKLNETLEKVKLLSGFLPICASCKKIRNDKGYWNQIESYIRNHSEAEFKHSICPDCEK